jgi:hypothetical protein
MIFELLTNEPIFKELLKSLKEIILMLQKKISNESLNKLSSIKKS